MTFNLSRPLFAMAALVISGTLLTATATNAQASGPYRLVAADAAKAKGKVVIRDSLWSCEGGACVANSVTSKPEYVCISAAKELGKLESFSANGRDFSSEELEKCNAKAQ